MENATPEACRIFVVDDHPGVREGLALLLERRGIAICGDAEDAAQTLSQLASAQPDLVLVDLSLQRESGVDLIGQLRSRGMRVLVYSMHEDAVHIKRAFSAGADGYVTKREDADALVWAIREVVAGNRHLSERSRNSLIDDNLDEDGPEAGHTSLSDRERLVLERMGQGDSSADIADRLHISPRTVETYYARIIEKLQLANMKELRRHAIQQGREGSG